MGQYFGSEYGGGRFEFFTAPHWSALLILLAVYVGLYLSRHRLRNPLPDRRTRYILATLLILQEISLSCWRLYNGTWSVADSLPLHLCGAAVVLSAIMLVNKSYRLYEINYFWGLGGAIQALLTPDIGQYGFPHYRFFQFFFSHGMIILASLYLTFVSNYRPRQRSVWRVFLITNIYLVFIAVFNWATGANYLFICRKPPDGSLMDFMGPWPWYILTLEFVCLASFYIYYTPFGIANLVRVRITKHGAENVELEVQRLKQEVGSPG